MLFDSFGRVRLSASSRLRKLWLLFYFGISFKLYFSLAFTLACLFYSIIHRVENYILLNHLYGIYLWGSGGVVDDYDDSDGDDGGSGWYELWWFDQCRHKALAMNSSWEIDCSFNLFFRFIIFCREVPMCFFPNYRFERKFKWFDVFDWISMAAHCESGFWMRSLKIFTIFQHSKKKLVFNRSGFPANGIHN